MRIDGRDVLLTGATGGLGHSIARQLHRRGARLILTGRRQEVLEALAAELGARAVVVDLAERAQVARLVDEAGPVDILVANAALPASGRLESYTSEQVDRALEVNLRAPIALAHALMPGMVTRRAGQLVFISSLAGKSALAGASLYSATKFGLRGFALSLRADLHASGVGVSAVFPGMIRDAGMFDDAGVKLPPGVGTRTPDDVARAVIQAIEEDRGEIDVAPLALRTGAALSGLAPGLLAGLTRRLGGEDMARQMADAQTDKR